MNDMTDNTEGTDHTPQDARTGAEEIMSKSESVINLSRFRADVSRALMRRGKKMLEASNLPAQVAGLAPLEAYFIIKELGVDDALPILLLANAEQLQTCIDLDCWDGADFSPEDLDAWLAPFASEGGEALAKAFLLLDSELQVMFLAASVEVWDTRSEEEPEVDDDVPRLETMDGFFVLHGKPVAEREVEPFMLIQSLYRHDIHEAFRLLMAAKWEFTSGLEESEWGFRVGRLQDLGFPTRDDAARLFATPAPAPLCVPMMPVPCTLPAIYASALAEASLVTRAMARIADPSVLDRLESELVYLVNAAVVAYGESPRDLSHVGDIAARVRDTLSLGLEVLLSPNVPISFADGEQVAERAAALLHAWPLMQLFQHGAHAVQPLGRAAATLAKDPVIAAWLNVGLHPDDDPEAADRAFLRALVQPRPLLAGTERFKPTQARAFATQAAVVAAQQRLDVLATRLL